MDHLKAARPFSDLTFNLKVKGPRKTADNYNDGTVGQCSVLCHFKLFSHRNLRTRCQAAIQAKTNSVEDFEYFDMLSASQ